MEDTLVGFELAKLAKEKKFREMCHSYYFEDGELRQYKIEDTHGYYGEEYTVELSELYNNWNDDFLTKKNGERCFGCSKNEGYFETYSTPTQSLLQKWLREKHNIDIYCIPCETQLGDITLWKSDDTFVGTYEEALEVGLIKGLKLIKL